MSSTIIGGKAGGERWRVIGLAAVIVITVGVYVGVKWSILESTGTGGLLPYQTLAATMPSVDQSAFDELQRQVVEVERARATEGRWPGAATLTSPSTYGWTHASEGFFVTYLGTPSDDRSAPAWLIRIQEPDPQAPLDLAPNDETHHRLPDGTVLHVTIWTHRFGGQVSKEFVRQPEASGWTQVLRAPTPVAAPVGTGR